MYAAHCSDNLSMPFCGLNDETVGQFCPISLPFPTSCLSVQQKYSIKNTVLLLTQCTISEDCSHNCHSNQKLKSHTDQVRLTALHVYTENWWALIDPCTMNTVMVFCSSNSLTLALWHSCTSNEAQNFSYWDDSQLASRNHSEENVCWNCLPAHL